METQFEEEIPGAKRQDHVKIKNAMHYAQDDEGEELTRVVIRVTTPAMLTQCI
jgi:hypothetical protein